MKPRCVEQCADRHPSESSAWTPNGTWDEERARGKQATSQIVHLRLLPCHQFLIDLGPVNFTFSITLQDARIIVDLLFSLRRLLPLHQICQVVRALRCFRQPGFLRLFRLTEDGSQDPTKRVRAVDGASAVGVADGYGRLTEFDELRSQFNILLGRLLYRAT